MSYTQNSYDTGSVFLGEGGSGWRHATAQLSKQTSENRRVSRLFPLAVHALRSLLGCSGAGRPSASLSYSIKKSNLKKVFFWDWTT
uniref:Uncharacterized protein n=1 Tax=Anguilla anguilla TaxID=7936 RepID=A0A0E9WWY0_ANGAN